MITCIRCNLAKPLAEYYAGNGNECKDCAKQRVRANYRKAVEARREYERERSRRPERRAKQITQLRKYRERHPDKNRARQKLSHALQRGLIVRQPCQVCGTTEGVEGHHEDYSRPLDVMWFCRPHHREYEGRLVTVA